MKVRRTIKGKIIELRGGKEEFLKRALGYMSKAGAALTQPELDRMKLYRQTRISQLQSRRMSMFPLQSYLKVEVKITGVKQISEDQFIVEYSFLKKG
ncbi:MAG: hypothetical protein ACTSYR_06050 [Candidatus Odinarchaeia archaeon]